MKSGFLKRTDGRSPSPLVAEVQERSRTGLTLSISETPVDTELETSHMEDSVPSPTDGMQPVFLYLSSGNDASANDTAIIARRSNAEVIATWPFWTASLPATMSEQKYHLSDVAEKGLWLVAARDLSPGELVVQERPFLVVAQDCLDIESWEVTEAAISGLSPASQRAFLELPTAFPNHPFPNYGRFRTHALDIELFPDHKPKHSLFRTICRAAHECTPTAVFDFDVATFTGSLRTVRHLRAGEPLTLSYGRQAEARASRQAYLRERFNLVCDCRTCSLPPEQIAQSDLRREAIRRVLTAHHGALAKDDVDLAIEYAGREKLRYLEAELLRRRLYYCSFQNLMELVAEGERVRRAFMAVEGPDSRNAKKVLEWLTKGR